MEKCNYCDAVAKGQCAFCNRPVCEEHDYGRIWTVCHGCYEVRRQLEEAADSLETNLDRFDPDTREVLRERLNRPLTLDELPGLLRALMEEE